MPPAPAKPEPPQRAVTTCTCGYDLTGLPANAAAKCPECGAVVAELRPRLVLWPLKCVLVALLFTPALVWYSGINAPSSTPGFDDPLSAGLLVMFETAASFFVVSIPALIVLVVLLVEDKSLVRQIGVSLGIYFGVMFVLGLLLAALYL